MNRPMKFRAWDEEKKEMIYFSFGFAEMFGYFSNIEQMKRLYRLQWMEFTGLFDKNEKEIYEGDVLRMYLRDTKPQPLEVTSSVFYSQGTFTAMALNGEPMPLRDSVYVSNKAGIGVEVIGDLYRNPELIPTPS